MAPLNVPAMLVTAEVSQLPMFALNAHMPDMSVTAAVFQSPIGGLHVDCHLKSSRPQTLSTAVLFVVSSRTPLQNKTACLSSVLLSG